MLVFHIYIIAIPNLCMFYIFLPLFSPNRKTSELIAITQILLIQLLLFQRKQN